MENSTGSSSIDKPWDHAWSTEEMRKNRRDWSLAADSGLLKNLQQFSENLTKKANETQNAIESMTANLNETAILVDNLTNTSLALANTQFIESRVQEDNIEVEQPVEDVKKIEQEPELSATDLLVSVCESIRKGLTIMDEKYEKVEVVASDSEDEDDNTVPSVILKPKDPYQDRPLPYVIGSEQWKSSNKVGLESSSSESEQEEDESASDTDTKNIGNVLSSNTRANLGLGRMSSTSSESNDFNIESNSIKDTDKSRLYARSQDTLNSETEPTTPSSVLPKTQNVNNGPSSFAEELAKRLGSVLPVQRNVIIPDPNEQVVNHPKDDLFSPDADQPVFSNKSDNLFNKGKNLFSDEISSSSWKDKPARPVNKNIIPASIDVPPPLSNIASAPKSTIDDLFGDPEDSDDSDDIFSNKSSKTTFAAEREVVKSDVASKQKHLNVDKIQNMSTMTTSTPELNDKAKGLFEDEDDDDLFTTSAKEVKQPDTSSIGSAIKKPVGGVSIFGKVDILSSSKFARRQSSSSSSDSDASDRPRAGLSGSNLGNATISAGTGGSSNASSSLEASNDAANVAILSNNSGNTGSSSSGISVHPPSIDNTAGSSLGADFQPLMSSSRLKSEEIYRERVPSDSLFASKSRTDNSSAEQQQQRQQQSQVQQSQSKDASENEDVFGPPPLPKASDAAKPKSKVASLFDDSDSGDDLFASASPGARSLRSAERTPSRGSAQAQKKSLFDDEDDLFGEKDAPDVDLFGGASTRPAAKSAATGLFDDVPPIDAAAGLFKEPATPASVPKGPSKPEQKVAVKIKSSRGLFDESEDSDDSDLFGSAAKVAPVIDKPSVPAAPTTSKGLFEDVEDSGLFGGKNAGEKSSAEKKSSGLVGGKPADVFREKPERAATKKESPEGIFKAAKKTKKLTTSIFDDSDDDDDLFGSSKKPATKHIFQAGKSSSSVAMDEEKKAEAEEPQEREKEKVADKPGKKKPEAKSVGKKSIFSDDDEDDDDLFGDKKKKATRISDKPATGDESPEPVSKASPEIGAKPGLPPKSALFAEMKQKLEKQHQAERSAESVDGAVSSKRDPPKTLKLQTGLPLPSDETNQSAAKKPAVSAKIKSLMGNVEGIKIPSPIDTPVVEEAAGQAVPKKPAVSAKIKGLLGNMEGLKILSPTDVQSMPRKNNEEKNGNDTEHEAAGEPGSSGNSTPSLASGASSPHTSGSRARDSPSLRSDNTEGAISFDEPIQVETLTSIASKSRARIQTKRRPQSRQARQSALRQSGIDFDVPDVVSSSPTAGQQPNGDLHPGPAVRPQQLDGVPGHADDRSELSASRNTTTNLLSPSTDEEDLFDVPPDLPEDPTAKEDSLFGRAPILSPIQRIERPANRLRSAADEDRVDAVEKSTEREESPVEQKEETTPKPLDPLRDESHDPLKDPSQLFAFVTKTPSPEKNKGLILNEEDDSLFSSSSKTNTKQPEVKTKPSRGLFDDDDDDDTSGNDLFSSSKTKIEKKPLKDTKIDLFDEAALEDDDESLFGASKKSEKSKSKESAKAPTSTVTDEAKSEPKSTKQSPKDIFDDSTEEDDIFTSSKKTVPKKQSKSLFDDDDADDDDDIFGSSKPVSMQDSKTKIDNSRPLIKKAVTRDLKKTAEKIVEDPLSVLRDD